MFVQTHDRLHIADAFGVPALPTAIDSGGQDAPMLLARLETCLTHLPPRLRAASLRNVRLTIPPPETHGHGVVLLPGGAVGLRCGLEGVLVCDPLSAVTLTAGPARRLRRAIAAIQGVQTVFHDEAGLHVRFGLPGQLPFQACSLLPDAAALACLPMSGMALVQWRPGGAVAWRLVEAPPSLALAASVAGLTLEGGARPRPAADWDASGQQARIERIAPGLYERVSDLLVGEVGDDLRWTLAEGAVHGEDSLAARLAEALRLLPAQFSADPAQDPGAHLLAEWPRAASSLSGPSADLALLGVEGGAGGLEGLAALRDVLDHEGLFFTETGPDAPFVPLSNRQARTLAQRFEGKARYGALMTPPASAADLFALAETLARRIDGCVTVAAPCWNFYHRFDARTEAEAGNASWFGMGAGLDELEWL